MILDPIYLWLIAAIVLAGADVLLGTVYLLVLGASAIAAFAAAVCGVSFLMQLAVFALFGIFGCVLLSFKKRSDSKQKTLSAQRLQHMNDGQLVTVSSWREDGSADVFYRGTHWRAEPEGSEPRRPGLWRIVGMDANTLILKFERDE